MNFRKSSCTLFAATALALAGCGESDSTTYTNPVPDLLITIGQQERKAAGAKDSASMSLKDATTKATMLSAVKVMGESSDAEANAQAVLDAKAKVDSALTEATAALTALQEAKTEADALPADTPKLEELKAELAKAITEATRNRDAIQALKDATGAGSLAKLVEKVTGTGDKKMTPADIAAAVAQEVEKIMTFQIGFREATAPITGGKTPSTWVYPFTLYAQSNNFGNSAGSIEALNDDYASFLLTELPGARVEKTDYAVYGYWLGIPKGGDSILGPAIFGFPKNDGAVALDKSLGTNSKLGATATYSGKALGMSVLTEPDGTNHKAIKSGEFMADVKLTASFGDNPTVKGTVNNFKGNAVGADWSVELKEAPILKTHSTAYDDENYGLTRGSGAKHDGAWQARAEKGLETQRPNSLSGMFTTFFSNGRAMGGYATVKDD